MDDASCKITSIAFFCLLRSTCLIHKYCSHFGKEKRKQIIFFTLIILIIAQNLFLQIISGGDALLWSLVNSSLAGSFYVKVKINRLENYFFLLGFLCSAKWLGLRECVLRSVSELVPEETTYLEPSIWIEWRFFFILSELSSSLNDADLSTFGEGIRLFSSFISRLMCSLMR